jgi:hypothetical protein
MERRCYEVKPNHHIPGTRWFREGRVYKAELVEGRAGALLRLFPPEHIRALPVKVPAGWVEEVDCP